MIEIFSPSDRPYSEIKSLGVVVSGGDQRHVGILIRPEDHQAVRVVHLAFHHTLKCDDPINDAVWLHCLNGDRFDDDRVAMAAWLEVVAEVNKDKIPYAFEFSDASYFDLTGSFQIGAVGRGLTCATFVLAIFRDFGFPVIKVNTWHSRPGDEEWRIGIVEALRRYSDLCGVSEEHIQAQIRCLGTAVRYRPEDVAASVAQYQGVELEFSEIEQSAAAIAQAAAAAQAAAVAKAAAIAQAAAAEQAMLPRP